MKKLKKIDNFYKFIIAILILKIGLMGVFSSDYQNQLFMKFVYGFLNHLKCGDLINPYEVYRDMPELFPYPPIMLIIECIGGIISSLVKLPLFIQNILFKLPNLLFDCLGCWYLVRMFPQKRKYIGVLYFASPIIVYASYMHGQLDIIPTTFLVAAMYYLTDSKNRNELKFILCLTGAMGSKLHIVAVVPILFLFIAKRNTVWKAIKLIGSSIAMTIAVMIPFWGPGFLYNVLLNNEQSILTKIYVEYASVRIYIPLLAVGLLYLKTFSIKKINKDLLYSLCGVLFTVFLILIPPMPGWYIWIVPFVAIFFIDIKSDKYRTMIIYVLLNIMYLLYFIFGHHTHYVDLYMFNTNLSIMKIQDNTFVNLLFTGLTCILIYSAWLMYEMGVTSNSIYKRRNMPFTIGLSGDSGSGKSTFILLVKKVFGEKNLLFIEGDGDHKWERGNAMWTHFTHLNPKANFIYRQASDIVALRNGQNITRVDYDHKSGTFTKESKIKPKPYIMLCGLHALYLPQVRANLDLKIYMDIDETLRRYWKIQRDISSRSYSKETILSQIEERMQDAQRYIYPQKKYADLLVSYFDESLMDCMDENHTECLSLKLTIGVEIDIERLIQVVEAYGIDVSYDYDEDLQKQTVVFTGKELNKNTIPVYSVAYDLLPQLEELVQDKIDTDNNLQGILELILLILVSYKMSGVDKV